MTRQDYNLRMAYLGLSSREVADAAGCSSSKLSDSLSPHVHTPSAVTVRNRADDFTRGLVNEKRAEIKAQIGEVLKGDVQVILPADNRIVVVMDGELIGFYNPLAKKFVAVT